MTCSSACHDLSLDIKPCTYVLHTVHNIAVWLWSIKISHFITTKGSLCERFPVKASQMCLAISINSYINVHRDCTCLNLKVKLQWFHSHQIEFCTLQNTSKITEIIQLLMLKSFHVVNIPLMTLLLYFVLKCTGICLVTQKVGSVDLLTAASEMSLIILNCKRYMHACKLTFQWTNSIT